MKLVTALFIVLAATACGGSGGGGESVEPFDLRNLSSPPALRMLYDGMVDARKKSDFETTPEYDNRVALYATSLAGYRSTKPVRASYNADNQELRIGLLPTSIDEGVRDTQTPFYMGFTEMRIENLSGLYEPVTREETDFRGNPITVSYYKIVSATAAEAQRIIDGFRVDYQHEFSAEQVKRVEYYCFDNFTRCTNFLYGDVSTFRVYNVVDGMNY